VPVQLALDLGHAIESGEEQMGRGHDQSDAVVRQRAQAINGLLDASGAIVYVGHQMIVEIDE
jgi:hypothetical protein